MISVWGRGGGEGGTRFTFVWCTSFAGCDYSLDKYRGPSLSVEMD